jgi:phosphomannomutase/phosphoglucomutase
MWKTGHSLIKQKMKEEKAALAAEVSGHIFFADRYFGFDDATYAACRLLEILSATKKSVSSLLEGIPKVVTTPEIRMECPDDIKFKVVERAVAYFKKEFPVIDIDGARFQFPGGWGLVRASNTQPALVMRFEAPTQERVAEIKTRILDVLARIREEI